MRFIINLPLEELAEAERTCFQIEEAQWFYEDFIRPLDPDILPALNLRNFYMLICQYCPILCDYPAEQHAEAFERFLKYKTRVPVRGAIMLNEAMDAVVLVKGWKKNANWSFPRGKINKEESDSTCAVREVYEETGYDLEAAGLVADGENTKSIEVTMREQSLKLFVFRDVPMDTHFEPRTRKEISKIQWYKLSELPTIKKSKQHQEEKGEALANNANKFYMVAPFLGHLKKWITQQRKLDKSNPNHRTMAYHHNEVSATTDVEDQHVEEGSGGRGDIDRLLDAHRQRKQQVPQQIPSDLPGVSQATPPARRAQPPAHIDTAHNIDPLNKVDLLAILKGGNKLSQEPPPQTPATQIIEEPIMPHSPPHHHLSRMPTLPMVPTLPSMQSQSQEPGTMLPNMPQVKAVPPPAEPGRIVPQARHFNYNSSEVTENVDRQVPSLYRQAANSHLPTSSSQPGNQGPSIPPASNLPKPILTQQKATLLDLFKKGKATEKPVEAAASATVPTEVKDVTPKPSTMFVPPQVVSRSSTEKASPTQSVTDQKANLLAMFKTPSSSKVAQAQDKQSSLKLPSAPIELSALPSPGHSREPSETEPESNKLKANDHITIQRRPSPVVSKQDPPVGATISGPLNIPQFDMIAKHHRETKDPAHKNGTKPEKRPPVTILARAGSSHAPAASAPAATTPASIVPPTTIVSPPIESSRRRQKPAPPTRLLTSAKPMQPLTPNLEAQSTPPKPFHPQILKRPAHLLNEHTDMSPIQPLPSPKQAFPFHKPAQKAQSANADHKKSLLSLFTAPSPVISPPSANIGKEESLASLVSPISDHRGPQSGFERQASWKENKTVATVEQRRESATGTVENVGMSDRRSGVSPSSIDEERNRESPDETRPTVGNGEEPEHKSSAKETPNELKNLLLGQLANIKV